MSKLKYLFAFSILAFFIFSCSKDEESNVISPTTSTPNILLIIADDLGKDAIKGYQEGSIKPNN